MKTEAGWPKNVQTFSSYFAAWAVGFAQLTSVLCLKVWLKNWTYPLVSRLRSISTTPDLWRTPGEKRKKEKKDHQAVAESRRGLLFCHASKIDEHPH